MTLPRAMNSRNSPRIGARFSTAFKGSRVMGDVGGLFVAAQVEPLAQLLAALEEGHVLGAHRDRLAGARIAPGAGVAGAHGERAEAAQLHPAPLFEGLDHPLQNHTD